MYDFYAFLSRMRYIKRWSLMRSVVEENIAEHSQQVAVLAHALALINNKYLGGNINVGEVVMLSQYHEAAEVILGDLPTPVKYYNTDIKTAYKQLEEMAANRLVKMLPPELECEYEKYIRPDTSSYEYKIVKAADKLSAYLKCIEELKSGNLEFKKAKETIEADLNAKQMPELKIFMEKFLPSFEKTLDELS